MDKYFIIEIDLTDEVYSEKKIFVKARSKPTIDSITLNYNRYIDQQRFSI